MWGLLTGLMTWTYAAMHPNDNLVKAAFEWPVRLYKVGRTVRNGCCVKSPLKWEEEK